MLSHVPILEDDVLNFSDTAFKYATSTCDMERCHFQYMSVCLQITKEILLTINKNIEIFKVIIILLVFNSIKFF